jgi:methylmalonyl-CoA carboxyltransferase large subunit
MGPEGAVNILFRKQLAAAEDDDAREALRAQLVAGIKQSIDPYLAARMAFVDDLIDPADTRRHICAALDAAAGKSVLRPARKRGVSPV